MLPRRNTSRGHRCKITIGRREEAFKGTYIMKFLSLGFVLAAITFAPGCISYSSTTRTAPAPAPAPPPAVQRTVYSDGTYVDQPVQPAPPFSLRCTFWQPLPKMRARRILCGGQARLGPRSGASRRGSRD